MAQLLPHETECTDVTARRVHQFGVVALAVTGTALAWAAPEVPAGALVIEIEGVTHVFGIIGGNKSQDAKESPFVNTRLQAEEA